jgi:hypothetical protein
LQTVPGRLPLVLNRKFHLGKYESGHAQLLLRSGRSGYHDGEHLKYDSVADVLFKNVSVLAVAESYHPLEVALGGPAEFAGLHDLLNCELGDRKLYVLRSSFGGPVGYVVAGAVYWTDDPDGSTGAESVLLGGTGRVPGAPVFAA